jgi:sigma-B regulation protein RsbU (phosphoserine phosphatase)
LVTLGLSAVAYAEKSVPSFSFAPLYILPLALSALVHPLRVSLVLAAVCLSLHDLLGPAPIISIQHVTKDVVTLFGFFFVVIIVNQLGMQRKRLAELAKRERDELAREVQLAAEVQQSILPRSIPSVPGFELAARMYPAKIVAGDYYGFITLPQGEIGLVIADVSGKGVAAGLLMPSIEVVLQMDAPRFPSPCDLLRSFNKVVCQITDRSRFISLFYGKLCPQSRMLEYTNAGHNPPLLIRAGADPIPLDKGGLVLGLLPGADYESDKVELRAGDVLVLYTDGTVEAENPAGEEYSARRLATVVSSHLEQSPSELIETIHASVVEFAETARLADDLTLVVLKTL